MSIRFLRLLSSAMCALGLSACGAEEPLEASSADALAQVEQALFYDVNLGSSMGSPVATGTTTGWSNNFASNCNSNGAEDKAFYWTAPYTGEFTFSLAGSSYDTVLQVLNADQNVSLGCNDDANGTLQSSLTRVLTAGQRVTIVVDGYSTRSGSFQLNISGTSMSALPTTSLQFWLRSDTGITASGGLISSWADQSGQGHNATMATTSRQPSLVTHTLNNWPVVRFGGAQSFYLTSPVRPTTFTVFVVGKNSMPTETFSMILGPGGNWANNQLRWENGSQALFVGTGNNMPVITSNIGNTRTYHELSARYDGAQMSVYRNDLLISTHSFSVTSSWDLSQVGGYYSSYFMQGDLAEVIIYGRALSSTERQAVNTYLRMKYNLQ